MGLRNLDYHRFNRVAWQFGKIRNCKNQAWLWIRIQYPQENWNWTQWARFANEKEGTSFHRQRNLGKLPTTATSYINYGQRALAESNQMVRKSCDIFFSHCINSLHGHDLWLLFGAISLFHVQSRSTGLNNFDQSFTNLRFTYSTVNFKAFVIFWSYTTI